MLRSADVVAVWGREAELGGGRSAGGSVGSLAVLVGNQAGAAEGVGGEAGVGVLLPGRWAGGGHPGTGRQGPPNPAEGDGGAGADAEAGQVPDARARLSPEHPALGVGVGRDETPTVQRGLPGGTVRDGGTLPGVRRQEGGAAGEESGAASRPAGPAGGHGAPKAMHGLLQGDPPDAMLHAWENGHLDAEGGRADEVHGEPSVGPDTGGAKVDASTTADPDGGIGAAVMCRAQGSSTIGIPGISPRGEQVTVGGVQGGADASTEEGVEPRPPGGAKDRRRRAGAEPPEAVLGETGPSQERLPAGGGE